MKKDRSTKPLRGSFREYMIRLLGGDVFIDEYENSIQRAEALIYKVSDRELERCSIEDLYHLKSEIQTLIIDKSNINLVQNIHSLNKKRNLHMRVFSLSLLICIVGILAATIIMFDELFILGFILIVTYFVFIYSANKLIEINNSLIFHPYSKAVQQEEVDHE